MPLSLQMLNEVAREVTASRVLGLGRVPVRADSRCGGIRLERDDHLDLGERDLQLSQGGYQPGAVELRRRVVAIPGVIIDARWLQQTELVIEPERLRREPGVLRELPDAY